MSTVGQRERKTQERVVELFSGEGGLGYEYLGHWQDRPTPVNIEEDLLHRFLAGQGVEEELIRKALKELRRLLTNRTLSLYDLNKDFYELLRYGVSVKRGVGEQTERVWLVDWKNPERNHFAIAEEVTVVGKKNKRPDIVLYVNGIAVGVLELKRSIVSVSAGIRQQLESQTPEYVERFFGTVQLVMAGNDTQGLRYGVIETREKYFLAWKEEGPEPNLLDRNLVSMCRKDRLIEIMRDFIVFDAGIKKTCRPNQYFGVKAAQERVGRREGGIIWHTQGSGKSLTMVWLAKWLRETINGARVLIITDRTELDEQIKKVFLGVSEEIHRTTSGADLIAELGRADNWLLCSLIHKFGSKTREDDPDIDSFVSELLRAIPAGFQPHGDIYVFVDECHRTQSGDLHDAMKKILPDAMFIGFTGTPLLAKDKRKSIEAFGSYIHTYKYDEAVSDGVVLDLRYEARDIDQNITSQERIDQWFEAKTRGLTDIAKAQLKAKWGTMQKVLSSLSRLEKIVDDILLDMEIRDRLRSGKGNALLVTSSIYEACKCYEMFSQKGLGGRCAIITSYKPSASDTRDEISGEGLTERLRQYEIYRGMLAKFLNKPEDEAVNRTEEFETLVKEKFVKEPGRMKLLIVVDKLLTGFDAPPATYLYIDRGMRDHGLFQAICRVNRLDTDDKEYGYIVDYKDLFRNLEKAVEDYTSEAFDGYDAKDVEGLLKNRVDEARKRLEEVREACNALCEPVEVPRNTPAYMRYFLTPHDADEEGKKEHERRRLMLYRLTSSYLRAYADLANEMTDAGYTTEEAAGIKADVEHYEKVRSEIKFASGDYIDLKMFEPAMRHLMDTYIRAEESEKLSSFDDLTLIDLVVQKGAEAVSELPKDIKGSDEAVAESIEGNVRRVIVDESPINPRYYERMSSLLDALIRDRKASAISYKEYLDRIVALARQVKVPETGQSYPATLTTPGQRALYDNLDQDEQLAMAVDQAIKDHRQDDWADNLFKTRRVRNAIRAVVDDDVLVSEIVELAKRHPEYC